MEREEEGIEEKDVKGEGREGERIIIESTFSKKYEHVRRDHVHVLMNSCCMLLRIN